MKTIYQFYKKPDCNGYGVDLAEQRFEILKRYEFGSVLDVGSGPCYLQKWLEKNNIPTVYEAVDIRKDSLELCNCKTHLEIPDYKFDLVCLFGTIGYNVGFNEEKNKQILKSLLLSSKSIANKLIILSLFDSALFRSKNLLLVTYTKTEIENLLNECEIKKYEIIKDESLDPLEFFVVCEMN